MTTNTDAAYMDGMKTGLIQGIFFGGLVAFIIAFTLLVPSQAKQLKEYVMSCIEFKYEGRSYDSVRECIAEEFDNVFDI
jgi:gas vesicle protein